jgi:hypothetical protein
MSAKDGLTSGVDGNGFTVDEAALQGSADDVNRDTGPQGSAQSPTMGNGGGKHVERDRERSASGDDNSSDNSDTHTSDLVQKIPIVKGKGKKLPKGYRIPKKTHAPSDSEASMDGFSSDNESEVRDKGKKRQLPKGYRVPKAKATKLPAESDDSTTDVYGLSSSNDDKEDSNSDSNSDSEDFDWADTGSESDCPDTPPRNKSKLRGMFDPMAKTLKHKWKLPSNLADYTAKYFTEWIGEDAIQKSILKRAPTPDLDVLKALTVDTDIMELLSAPNQTGAKITDTSFLRVQRKNLEVMGPLGKLWRTLEKAKQTPDTPCDLTALLKLVQQAVLVLGQGNVLAHYNRRLNILSRFFHDQRKASDILKQNDKLFQKTRDKLFGSSFYKALYKRAKGDKQSREIKFQLGHGSGGSARKRGGGQGKNRQSRAGQGGKRHPRPNGQGPGQGQRQQSQPFHQGPPSSTGWKGPRKGSGPGKPKSRYVYFCCPKTNTKYGTKTNPHTRDSPRTSHSDTRFRTKHEHGAHGNRTHRADTRPKRSCTRRGKVTVVPRELGTDHPRHAHFADDHGERNRIPVHTPTASTSFHAPVLAIRTGKNNNRSCKHVVKKGDRTGSGNKRPVREQPVLATQKRRFNATDLQLEKTKRIRKVQTFQDGERGDVKGHVARGGLDDENRSERCILLHSHGAGNAEISPVPMGGKNISVSIHPIRLGIGPPIIHQSPETDHSIATTDRDSSLDLPRRPDYHESESRESSQRFSHSNLLATVPRVHNKLAEVSDATHTGDRVLRVPCELDQNDTGVARGQDVVNPVKMSRFARERGDNCENISSADRSAHSVSPGGPPGPTPLPTATNAENKKLAEKQSVLPGSSNIDPGEQGGATVVAIQPPRMEREGDHIPRPGPDLNHRRIQKRVGGGVSGGDDPRSVERGRSSPAHQCAGDDGGVFRREVLHKNTHSQTRSPTCRQQSDNGANKQDGGLTFTEHDEGHITPVAVLSVTKDHNYCRTPRRRAELHSRPTESRVRGQQRLEATTNSFSVHESDAGTSRHGSVCEQTEHTTGGVLQLETRPTSESSGCVQSDVESVQGVCFSPIQPDKQMPSESAERGSGSDLDHPDMASTAMVPESSSNVNRRTNPATATPKAADVPQGGAPPIGGNRRAKPSGLESLRQRTSASGLSDRATEVCMQARRPGTQVAYNGPWEKWSSWCSRGQIDSVQATVANVADFLTEMFDTGLEYSTMNSYRSAVSAYHPEIEGYPVGKHPVIKTLLQGMFNQRPPKPRYVETWDVDSVLRRIKSKGDDSGLSLKDLTLKVTMLLALASAGRGSEIHQLNPKLMTDRGNSLEFHIEGLTKTKRPSKPYVTIKILEFTQDQALNVVETVRKYLARTKPLRKVEKQKSQLLLSFVKPHKAVHKCTIARWLKLTMQETGIDTSVYKAHSTRMASVSKAKAQGLSTEQIMHRANWSRAATFHRFYHRETVDSGTSGYQNKVLTLK